MKLHSLAALVANGALFLSLISHSLADEITDAWDINQGSSITDTSGAGVSALQNMFGGNFSSPEPETAFFADFQPAGTTHWVEWQTASSIVLTSYHLQTVDDGTGGRGFTQFRLFAFDDGLNEFELIDTLTPASNPYPGNVIDHMGPIAPVNAQRFRAEFDQFSSSSFGGPRIRELDGFASVPEPALSGMIGLVGVMVIARRRRRRRIQFD